MFIDSITPRDLDSLSMLLNDPVIPLEERITMGRFATHLLRAELHQASVGDDAALLAFLLARWGFSLQDRDADIDDVLEAFEMQLDDASWVLGQSLGGLRAGIARLSSSGVISTTPRRDSVLVTFKPILEGITSKIEQRVYRDFYPRQGPTLHGLAEQSILR